MPGEELVRSERVYAGAILSVRRDTVRVHKEGASVDAIREVVDHPAAVTVVPVDADGNVLLVRQYRWAAQAPLLEAPAGRLEPGEAPAAGAVRELREETVHTAGAMTPLGGFWIAPGYSTEYMHVYLAKDLRADPLPADEDEDIAVERVAWDDLPRLVGGGVVQDGKSVAALQLAYYRPGGG